MDLIEKSLAITFENSRQTFDYQEEEMDRLVYDLSGYKRFTKEKTYLYLEFFQERIVPLIEASNNDSDLIEKFRGNKNKWEQKNLIPFPENDTEELVFHCIYTGEFRESQKNHIRAWALAHKNKNVKIKIWYVPETGILEEFDEKTKQEGLRRAENEWKAHNQWNGWSDSEKRKLEYSAVINTYNLKTALEGSIINRNFPTYRLGNITSESVETNIIDFLSGEKFLNDPDGEEANNRRSELREIYERDNISPFIYELRTLHENTGLNICRSAYYFVYLV